MILHRNEIDSWQATASRGTEKTCHPGTDQNIGELIEKPTNLYLLSPIASVNNQCSTELLMLCTFRIFVAISLIFHWQTTQNNHGLPYHFLHNSPANHRIYSSMWNLKFNIWFSKNYLNQNLGLDWTFKEGEWITADHANMHFIDINQTVLTRLYTPSRNASSPLTDCN